MRVLVAQKVALREHDVESGSMKEIALAGLMMTIEEWQSLDGVARAEIVAAVMQWEAPPISADHEAAATSGTGE